MQRNASIFKIYIFKDPLKIKFHSMIQQHFITKPKSSHNKQIFLKILSTIHTFPPIIYPSISTFNLQHIQQIRSSKCSLPPFDIYPFHEQIGEATFVAKSRGWQREA